MKDSKDSEELSQIFGDIKDAVGDLSIDQVKKAEPKPKLVGDGTFPTEMNCNQVFDMLLKCYSVGGQVRHYYRYGEMSYCQDKKDKLKFCLSTKLMTKEHQKEAISEWYMKQFAERKSKNQTSEDVWDARKEPLRRPFQE